MPSWADRPGQGLDWWVQFGKGSAGVPQYVSVRRVCVCLEISFDLREKSQLTTACLSGIRKVYPTHEKGQP